jgi:histidyl-tRNA synthetase
MKRADKVGASIALILGDDEITNQQITLKYLRENVEQEVVSWSELEERINTIFA